jgi:Skp family chaperone for outer membrane proteins
MKLTPFYLCAALALGFAGCQPPSTTSASPNGTIAIIDLDAAAKRLGRDVTITEELKAKNDALSETFTKDREKLQSELDKTQQELGATPTDEQKQQFVQYSQGLNQQLQAKLQAAREELNSKQTDLVRQFREEVKPIAQKVAAKKGMNTVLVRSDIVVLSADASVDITDDVVAEMIPAGTAAKPAATATPTPKP